MSASTQPRETRRTNCDSGKRAFVSRGAAERALARIRVSTTLAGVKNGPCRAYKCGCGEWHLTSKPKRRHLTVVPEPEPVVYLPTSPITEERRQLWEAGQRENERLRILNRWPWRAVA